MLLLPPNKKCIKGKDGSWPAERPTGLIQISNENPFLFFLNLLLSTKLFWGKINDSYLNSNPPTKEGELKLAKSLAVQKGAH